MDKPKQQTQHRQAMRARRHQPLEAVLPAGAGDTFEFTPDETHRCSIFEDALLRLSKNECVAQFDGLRRQSETSVAADANYGNRSHLPQTQNLAPRHSAREVPVFIEEIEHCAPRTGMGDRHHLHSSENRILVFGRHHRLVQSLRPVMGIVQHPGCFVLHSCARKRAAKRDALCFQQRSRKSIYQYRLHCRTQEGRHSNQHGWRGTSHRQHHGGTIVEKRQIRGSLPQGLFQRSRSAPKPQSLFRLLQQRASAPITRLYDAQTSPLRRVKNEICGENQLPWALKVLPVDDYLDSEAVSQNDERRIETINETLSLISVLSVLTLGSTVVHRRLQRTDGEANAWRDERLCIGK